MKDPFHLKTWPTKFYKLTITGRKSAHITLLSCHHIAGVNNELNSLIQYWTILGGFRFRSKFGAQNRELSTFSD